MSTTHMKLLAAGVMLALGLGVSGGAKLIDSVNAQSPKTAAIQSPDERVKLLEQQLAEAKKEQALMRAQEKLKWDLLKEKEKLELSKGERIQEVEAVLLKNQSFLKVGNTYTFHFVGGSVPHLTSKIEGEPQNGWVRVILLEKGAQPTWINLNTVVWIQSKQQTPAVENIELRDQLRTTELLPKP